MKFCYAWTFWINKSEQMLICLRLLFSRLCVWIYLLFLLCSWKWCIVRKNHFDSIKIDIISLFNAPHWIYQPIGELFFSRLIRKSKFCSKICISEHANERNSILPNLILEFALAIELVGSQRIQLKKIKFNNFKEAIGLNWVGKKRK